MQFASVAFLLVPSNVRIRVAEQIGVLNCVYVPCVRRLFAAWPARLRDTAAAEDHGSLPWAVRCRGTSSGASTVYIHLVLHVLHMFCCLPM